MTLFEEIVRRVAAATSVYGACAREVRAPLLDAVSHVLDAHAAELAALELEPRPGGYARSIIGITPCGCEVLVVETSGRRMVPHNHKRGGSGDGVEWTLVWPFVEGVWNRFYGQSHQQPRLLLPGGATWHDRASPLFVVEDRRAPIHRLEAQAISRSFHVYRGDTDGSEFFFAEDGSIYPK